MCNVLALKRTKKRVPARSSRPRRRRKTRWARFQHHIRTRLLSGLLVIVPLGVTFLIVRFLYGITAGILASAIRPFLGPLPPYTATLVSIVALVLVLYLIGIAAAAVVGRRLIGLGERIIQRIPLIKTVYSASKQVVETFSLQDRLAGATSVAFVEFPRPDMWVIAFVTGKIMDSQGNEYFKVFLPTTPNPTSGFMEFVPPERLRLSQMSVEDALKLLMSGGILAPQQLGLAPRVRTMQTDYAEDPS